MKKYLFWIVLSGLFFSFTFATTSYLTDTENGHAYKVMKVTLYGKSKVVVSVVNNYTPAQSLKTLMDKVVGDNAINGSYFCPNETAYSRCEWNTTDGLRISNGILYSKRWKDIGPNKSVFGFDEDWVPVFVSDKGSTKPDSDVDKIFNGIMMPTLVKDWVNVAVLNAEMNNDAKQGAVWNKTFICSNRDNNIVYMWYVDGVTFSSVADYIIDTFDCYNAIQLDNGWSKSMIYNGQYVTWPGRNIMDAFVVVTNNEKLQKAVDWMYTSGLTSKSNLKDYLANNTMTREEAAKFFSVFAKNEFNKTEDSEMLCDFDDIDMADQTLKNYIIGACKLGIFRWYKGNFGPKDRLTNAQAVTVLMRVMVWNLPEPTNAFYTNYVSKAKEIWLIENISVNDYISRWEAAILLYDASVLR